MIYGIGVTMWLVVLIVWSYRLGKANGRQEMIQDLLAWGYKMTNMDRALDNAPREIEGNTTGG